MNDGTMFSEAERRAVATEAVIAALLAAAADIAEQTSPELEFVLGMIWNAAPGLLECLVEDPGSRCALVEFREGRGAAVGTFANKQEMIDAIESAKEAHRRTRSEDYLLEKLRDVKEGPHFEVVAHAKNKIVAFQVLLPDGFLWQEGRDQQ